jgi:Ca2+-binding EF-hand superfamily protein
VFPRNVEDEFAVAANDALFKISDQLDMSPSGNLTGEARGSKGAAHRHAARTKSVSRRDGPVKEPKQLPKAHTWFMYRVFVLMAGGGLRSNFIQTELLQKYLSDRNYIEEILGQVSHLASLVVGPRERATGNGHRISIAGDKADLDRLASHIRRYFHDRNATAKLDALGEGSITLRAFFCVILHKLTEGDVEACLAYCQTFRSHDVLREYMEGGTTHHLNIEDLRLIFQAMDADGNGMLSVEELMSGGGLSEETARHLLQRLDEDKSGTISMDELHGIVRSIDTTLRSDFKDAFSKGRCRLNSDDNEPNGEGAPPEAS